MVNSARPSRGGRRELPAPHGASRASAIVRRHAAGTRRLERLGRHGVLVVVRGALHGAAVHAQAIYAAAMAFFGVLALFPLVVLLVSLITLLESTSEATSLVLGRVTEFFPGSAALVFRALGSAMAAQPAVVGVGFSGLLWSSTGVFLTMGYAMNRAWNVRDERHVLAQYGIAAGLAASVGVAAFLSVALSSLASLVYLLGQVLPRTGMLGIDALTLAGSNALDYAIMAGAAAVLYRLFPHTLVQWRDVLVPAGLMAVLWEGAKLVFTWYLGAVARVDAVYGPFAAIAGLMIWMYCSAWLLLFGAELSHQIARLRAHRGQRPPL